jgi:hypothetical protein
MRTAAVVKNASKPFAPLRGSRPCIHSLD